MLQYTAKAHCIIPSFTVISLVVYNLSKAHASTDSVDCACSKPPAEDHHGPLTEACPTRDKIHMVCWRVKGEIQTLAFQTRHSRLVPVSRSLSLSDWRNS